MKPQKRIYVDAIRPWEIIITEFKKGKKERIKRLKMLLQPCAH